MTFELFLSTVILIDWLISVAVSALVGDLFENSFCVEFLKVLDKS